MRVNAREQDGREGGGGVGDMGKDGRQIQTRPLSYWGATKGANNPQCLLQYRGAYINFLLDKGSRLLVQRKGNY